jgi:hypothetical protein
LIQSDDETVNISVYLRTKDRDLVKRAIRLLRKQVFGTWKHPPRFKAKTNGGCSDNEFELWMLYVPVNKDDTSHHEAMDLAMAFITGYLAGSKK